MVLERGGSTEKTTPTPSAPTWEQGQVTKAWAIFLFGFVGAAMTTLAVGQLRKSADWFHTQFSRSQSTSSWKSTAGGTRFRGFSEEAWRRYKRQILEEYEEKMARVERIRRMQAVFNRERNKYKRSYDNWNKYGPGAHQYYQWEEWYWKDTSYGDQRTSYRSSPFDNGNFTMSHHYSVLGLDGTRLQPYTDAEIKKAFRAKAMEFHPDQNPNNKEAEAKFKAVLSSYEAIKLERKNQSC